MTSQKVFTRPGILFRKDYHLALACTLSSVVFAVQLPIRAAEYETQNLPVLEAPPEVPAAVNSLDAATPVTTAAPPNDGIIPSSGFPTVESYTLGAGDQVRVDIFQLPEYSSEYEVLIDGTLSLPIVGQVAVAGLTLEQAERTISQAYAQRLRRPIIEIFLVTPRPLRVGIAGEVARPGEYILEREGTQFPSLVNALETAGGITQSADLRQVVVQRPDSSGGVQTFVANLWQFLNTGDLQYNLALQDGDTIYIPTRSDFDYAESLQLSAASFAAEGSQALNVAVVGEVLRPGPYAVSGSSSSRDNGTSAGSNGARQPTVSQAIQTAGGIQPEADLREVKIYRRTRNGTQLVIDVNLWALLTDGDITKDVALQEGDTVFVPEAETLIASEITEAASASFSPETIRINVVGEVEDPGAVEIPPNTPLSQGLLAAGGFNNRARQENVELIRLNPNGTATRTSIDVDFAAGLDEAENPLLRNNDVIVVGRSGIASFSDTLGSVVTPLGRAFSLFSIPLSILNLFD
ncbi:SLBB domain-containing protein [Synechococcus sp. PCC 7335]|uniref:SLBB domain-containing protein n=1 Tax=Synechococcus sp. (strain ATCC 29403 / PCC 7335) TaxID=91464 RepID=UPI0012F770B8|nr:SLBB domain-containing protein [Synechococcus sp. PCC 7335]